MESLSLAPWTAQRRQDLLGLFDQLNGRIAELSLALQREAAQYPAARRLMTHPGVGPITALAFTLVMGPWERFRCGKQVGSYLGLIPSEDSSGDHQRLGRDKKAWQRKRAPGKSAP